MNANDFRGAIASRSATAGLTKRYLRQLLYGEQHERAVAW
jgi:hypothetical protein